MILKKKKHQTKMVGFEAKKYLKTKTKKFTTKYDKTES